VFVGDDFHQPGPPDLAESAYYRAPVSLDHLDHVAAPSADPAAVRRRASQLESLQPQLLRMLYASLGPDAAAWTPAARRAAVVDRGAPMVWTYIATTEGLISGLPGMAVYPDGYDPRARSWFQSAVRRGHIGWAPPDWDETGMGLLMPCNAPIYDDAGALLGVVALDVSLGYVIDTLIVPRDLTGVEAWLVDADGQVVVQSSLVAELKTPPEKLLTGRPAVAFPYAELGAAVARGERDGLVVRDDVAIAWSHLDSVDWTYVVTGPAGRLIGE
jgi:hypothetical protein